MLLWSNANKPLSFVNKYLAVLSIFFVNKRTRQENKSKGLFKDKISLPQAPWEVGLLRFILVPINLFPCYPYSFGNKTALYAPPSSQLSWWPSANLKSLSCLQVAKSASRIALYMLREEMKESSGKESAVSPSKEKLISTVQHTHDFFVISSCKVMVRRRKRGRAYVY